jgi:hypothetical protein
VGDTTKDLKYFTDAISWIQGVAGQEPYASVDPEAIGVSGHSCGGFQTVGMRNNPTVRSFASFGYGTEQPQWAADFTAPVAFFVGSLDTSIAMPQIEGGWPNLPGETPAWWGTYPNLGHDGTFSQPNGGVWAKTFAQWVLLTLGADGEAKQYFVGGGPAADGWSEKKQNLETL